MIYIRDSEVIQNMGTVDKYTFEVIYHITAVQSLHGYNFH